MTRLIQSAFFLVIFAILGMQGAFAQISIQLNDNQDIVSLKQNFPYFKDTTNAKSFHQARAHFNRHSAFAPPPTEILDFGTEQSLYWFKLSINNQSQTSDWYFSLSDRFNNQSPLIEQLRVYDIKGDGDALFAFGNTETAPEAQKLLSTDFPLRAVSNSQQDYLIMIKTMKNLPFKAKPALMTASAYTQQQSNNGWAHSLILAASLIISSIAVTLFFTSSFRGFLLFALYVPLVIGGFFLFDGQFSSLSAYIPNSILNMIMAAIPGLIAGMSLFLGREALNLKDSKKIIDYGFILVGGATIITSVVIAVIPNLPDILIQSNLLLPTYAATILLTTSVFYAIRQQSLFLFALAWLILPVTHLLNILTLQQGGFAHLIILSLYMLFYLRSKILQSERNKINQHQDFETKIHALKVENEKERQALQRKRESEKNMLQDLRQRDAIRAHELKVAKAEADQANIAKSDFLAMISHEIRTPMTGIMGMVQLTLESDLGEQQREYIDTIKYSGETLLALLNDILDFSKIESGHMELENLHFALRRLLKSVVMLMSGRANEQGLELKLTIDDDIPDLLQGDPNRIRQILLNLLSNAIKFTKTGSVTIAVTQKGGDNTSINLLFSVIDTGIGISESAQEKLFGAYQQADESISRRYGGTGLGLNICKMLTEAMGGNILVKSTQGKGSTFAFNIPLKIGTQSDDKEKSDQSPIEESTSTRPLQILVIDDNEINLKVLTGLLEKDGHSVVTAHSGEEALTILEEKKFDLVLTDMRMPVMDGTELCRKIRTIPPIKDLPVIAVTGNTSKKDIDECYSAGMNGFLVKPPSREAIRTTIDKAMSGDTPAPLPKLKEKAEEVVEPKAEKIEKTEKDITPPSLKEVDTDIQKATKEVAPIQQDTKPKKEQPVVSSKSTPKPEIEEVPKTAAPIKEPLSATANMADTVMHEMTQASEASKVDNTAPAPAKSAKKEILEDHKKGDEQTMTDDKKETKKTLNDIKGEAQSFYKKAKASVMLGLGKGKIDENTLEDIVIEEAENTDEAEDIEDYSDLSEFDDEFAEDNLEEEETGPSNEELAEEAGQSVDLINIDMIKDLQNSLGKETLDELFGDLFTKGDEILGILEEAVKDNDYDDIGERGHELKGMAANFGLDRLAALGDAFEKAGMKRSKDRIDFLVPLYKPMLNETKTALEKWQSEQ